MKQAASALKETASSAAPESTATHAGLTRESGIAEHRIPETSGNAEALNTRLDSDIKNGTTFQQIDARLAADIQKPELQQQLGREPGPEAVEEPNRETQIAQNREDGMRRENEVHDSLQNEFPESEGNQVLRERYLLNEQGRFAKDPETGERRRIDFVVVDQNGIACRSIEVTSPDAPKDLQSAKEDRIRADGGNFVRNPDSGTLIDLTKVQTEIIRIP